MATFRAMAYLGWRALVAHPARRLRRRGSGLSRFEANYFGEGLVPTRPDDRAISEAAAACIGCGLCEPGCDLAGAVPTVRGLGLEAAFRLYSKSATALPWAWDALHRCAACEGCEASCPTGVPIGRIVRHLLSRAVLAPGAPAPPIDRAA